MKDSLTFTLIPNIVCLYSQIATQKKTKERTFKTDYHLMQVKSIAECILQYFRPALSYHLSLRPLFYLFWVAA